MKKTETILVTNLLSMILLFLKATNGVGDCWSTYCAATWQVKNTQKGMRNLESDYLSLSVVSGPPHASGMEDAAGGDDLSKIFYLLIMTLSFYLFCKKTEIFCAQILAVTKRDRNTSSCEWRDRKKISNRIAINKNQGLIARRCTAREKMC